MGNFVRNISVHVGGAASDSCKRDFGVRSHTLSYNPQIDNPKSNDEELSDELSGAYEVPIHSAHLSLEVEDEGQQAPPFSLEDSLYCHEQLSDHQAPPLSFQEELSDHRAPPFSLDSFSGESFSDGDYERPNHSAPCILSPQDLSWEEQELVHLLSKEAENKICSVLKLDPTLAMARSEAVAWILRAHAHFSFSPLTGFLAVAFLDRYFFTSKRDKDKPLETQLVAFVCLSIAAKLEETQVSLLLCCPVFEAKKVLDKEVLVLSALGWKMSSVTPFSFVDFMTRRLGFKGQLCWEFLRSCQVVLLATVSDVRFSGYLPSVLAAATMLHVHSSAEPSIEIEMLDLLGAHRDQVEECGDLITTLAVNSKKRKHA